MYKRLSAVLFPVMTVLLIGALVWGYQENKEKNAILINAENQYQRAFHDLSFHMDKLRGEIGNTLAVNSASGSMHRKGLVNVWRATSEAQNEINQLPLTMLPFNKTEEFLSKISRLAYQTSIRDLDKEPLSDKEIKTLQVLYKDSAQISKDLQAVQDNVINNGLRWMDVETAIANETENNGIVDGFRSVDNSVAAYPELDWGPSVASMSEKRTIRKLNGVPVTKEDIRRKAIKFADVGSNPEVQITENGKGTEWETYTAKVKKNQNTVISMDFTQNGGVLISYTDDRNVGDKKVDLTQSTGNADRFLEEKGYRNMTAVMADEYGNIGNITYVRNQDDVLIYPEKMTVRVGLDNGEVTGLQASEFMYEHKDQREIPQAKLSIKEARAKLNNSFNEDYNRLALIKDELAKEVLCYEFGGKVNGANYKFFISAEDGSEKAVEEMRTPIKSN